MVLGVERRARQGTLHNTTSAPGKTCKEIVYFRVGLNVKIINLILIKALVVRNKK